MKKLIGTEKIHIPRDQLNEQTSNCERLADFHLANETIELFDSGMGKVKMLENLRLI